MAHSAAQAVEAAVSSLSKELQGQHVKQLAEISAAVQTLLAEAAAQEARLKFEADWRSLVSDKEAENARLHAELRRLRQALDSSQKVQQAHAAEVSALQAQLQQALHENKSAHREAVLAATATGGPQAQVLQLQAELEAAKAQVSQLESELSSQLASSSARLTELQDSFLRKVEDMRRVHQEQMRGVQQQVEARAGTKALQDEVSSLRQQLRQATSDVASLQQQLAKHQQTIAQQQKDLLQAQEQASQQSTVTKQLEKQFQALKFEKSALEKHLETVTKQAAAAQNSNSNPPAKHGINGRGSSDGTAHNSQQAPHGNDPGAAVDLSMVNMMEGQLARLSEIIRTKEAETAQLRAAFHAGCDERKELLQEVQKLRQQLEQCGPGGSNMGPPGLPSPTGGRRPTPVDPGSVLKGTAALSPSKPYRTGPVSKPKFK